MYKNSINGLLLRLKQGLSELGLELNSKQSQLFLLYLNALADYSQRVNITNIRHEERIISQHFIDSLTCLLGFSPFHGMKVIDIGCGAGFPGLPLKICNPKINLTLLEASLKHIEFLYRLRGRLKIDFDILFGRAEEYGQNKAYRGGFDLAVGRGVAKLNILIEYSLPFLRIGGQLIAQKGPEIEVEVDEAKKALEQLGGQIKEIKDIHLPLTDKMKKLVVIDKIRDTPWQYPRRAGLVSKKPLKE